MSADDVTLTEAEREALVDVLGAELYEALMESSADQWRRWRYMTDAAKEQYRAEAERIILGAFMPAVERILADRLAAVQAERVCEQEAHALVQRVLDARAESAERRLAEVEAQIARGRTLHSPVDVYEMPDESAESLAARIEAGTAVLAFQVCAECAPDEVIERIEDGELDLSDGDALDAEWPCETALRLDPHADIGEVARASIRAALANPPVLAQHDAEVGARALREAADAAVPEFNVHPLNSSNTVSDWLRARADALTSDTAGGA